MKVLILHTREQAISKVVGIIQETIAEKPGAVIGLATGGTMLPVYRQLVSQFSHGKISFSRTSTFNLDEYLGLNRSHPCSYRYYMQKELFEHIDINQAHTHLPTGDTPEPEEEAARYERLIKEHGGIDLQLLGIGENGHIGFNEPTSSLSSRTRVKTLTDSTRKANKRFFANYEETPRYALTMGIGTILEADHCLLLASGMEKCEAVANMIEGPVTAVCPASALQLHPRATIVLDMDAASKLKLKDYYLYVHPG